MKSDFESFTYIFFSPSLDAHNASCDGCEIWPIFGKRYKCKSCLDYDLCQQCMIEEKHPRHEFEVVFKKPIEM